ncbi:MAG: hypothetical protein QXV17_10800 [Candidatus Micrarchaeaceae archaeon]
MSQNNQYFKIHMTHVLVSLIWGIAQLSTFAIMAYYHVSWNIWSDIAIGMYTLANSYFLSKWVISDTGASAEAIKQ